MMKNVQVGVVLAGGKGTRLGWLGKFLPKSLVPIGQKPMLYYIIKNLKSMKITKIYLLVNYKKNLIKRYLAEEPEFKEIDFYYIHSQPNLGLAQVIQKTERFIKEPFVVFLGDDFTICPKISQFPKKGLQKGIVAQEAVIRENDAKILSQTCEVFFDKEGKILKAHRGLNLASLQWQFMWARNVYRQIKNPIPGDIRNFLRQAKKIAALIHKTRSVEIADKETYQTIVAFLKIAGSYKY